MPIVLFHASCACHVLNLYANDGLKIINSHIEKLEIVFYMFEMVHGRHEFQSYFSERGKNVKYILLMLMVGVVQLMKC